MSCAEPREWRAVPELWPEKVFAWRRACCRLWLTAEQIITAMACFSASPDRVEVAISCWARCLDRPNYFLVLYAMSVRSVFHSNASHSNKRPAPSSARAVLT
jgi:hypothetical protein